MAFFLSQIEDTEQVGEQVTEQVKKLLVGIGDKKVYRAYGIIGIKA